MSRAGTSASLVADSLQKLQDTQGDNFLVSYERLPDCKGISLLKWHPHVHSIALDGGILPDGSFKQLPEVDVKLLEEFFAEKVFRFLLDEQRLDDQTVESMKAWEHSGFNFFAGEPIGAIDKDACLFLARYLKKAPIALERLSIDEAGTEPVVRYTTPPDDPEKDEVSRAFSPLEFLAELSTQVPRTVEQLTRFFGVYSPRTRKENGAGHFRE